MGVDADKRAWSIGVLGKLFLSQFDVPQCREQPLRQGLASIRSGDAAAEAALLGNDGKRHQARQQLKLHC